MRTAACVLRQGGDPGKRLGPGQREFTLEPFQLRRKSFPGGGGDGAGDKGSGPGPGPTRNFE